ncbi:MAG: RES domain-containing protein [Rubrobacteraceae bacterium]
MHRFDHHLGSPAVGGSAVGSDSAGSSTGAGPLPAPDPHLGVYYAARTLSGCLVELFGDDRLIEPAGLQVALAVVRRDLRLLDLRGRGAMRAGTVAAVTKVPDRALTQRWSRYFYEETEVYGEVDGLLYAGAYNDEDVICLYERAADALECTEERELALDDPLLRPAVLEAAQGNDLQVS